MWTPYNQIFVWRVLFSYFVQQSKCCLFQTIYFWIFCRENESMSWCYCSNFTCQKWKKMWFYLFDETILVSCLQNTRIRIYSSIFPSYHVVTSEKATTKKHTQLTHTYIHTEAHQPYIDRIKCISASFFSYIVLPNSCWFGLVRCSIHTHIHPCNPYDDNGVCFTLVWYAMKNQLQSEKKISYILSTILHPSHVTVVAVCLYVCCVYNHAHTHSLTVWLCIAFGMLM